jgi:hypothetical protein
VTGQSGTGHLGNSEEWSGTSFGWSLELSDGDGANRTLCRFRLPPSSVLWESIEAVESAGVNRPVGRAHDSDSRVRDCTWRRIKLASAVVTL